jgi:hypothetical protein
LDIALASAEDEVMAHPINASLTLSRRWRREQGEDAGQDGPWLHQLCRASELSLPAPPARVPSPAVQARLAKLRADLEAKKYAAMVFDVTITVRHDLTTALLWANATVTSRSFVSEPAAAIRYSSGAGCFVQCHFFAASSTEVFGDRSMPCKPYTGFSPGHRQTAGGSTGCYAVPYFSSWVAPANEFAGAFHCLPSVNSSRLQERAAEALREGGLRSYKDQLAFGAHVLVMMGTFYAVGHVAGGWRPLPAYVRVCPSAACRRDVHRGC